MMPQSVSHSLAWVLIHSLWQALLICGVAECCLRLIPARRSALRYGLSVSSLMTLVVTMAVTWSIYRLSPQDWGTGEFEPSHMAAKSPVGPHGVTGVSHGNFPSDHVVIEAPLGLAAPTDGGPTIRARVTPAATTSGGNLHVLLPWITAAWIIGAMVMLLRNITAVVITRRWSQMTSPTNPLVVSQLREMLDDLCLRLGLRRSVGLTVTTQCTIPAVVGTLWPTILIPAAMVTSIPVESWRIILAHELAHIRRHDALVNLAQLLIESILFYNPAVWRLSYLIRSEREACCDALAAEVAGQPLSVARTLVEFAAGLRGDARWTATSHGPSSNESAETVPGTLVAFADPANEGELTDRVQRLIHPDHAAHPRLPPWALLALVASLGCVALVLVWGTHVAVKSVAHHMSPRDRVETLERLQREATGVFLPPERKTATTPPASGATAAPDDATPSAEKTPEQITLNLIIRTEDGSPIPKNLSVSSLIKNGNSTSGSTHDSGAGGTPEYRKELTFRPGQLRIGAHAEGYAAAMTSVIDLWDSDTPQSIELVLRKGRTVTLRISDPQGKPLGGAQISYQAKFSIAGSSSSVGNFDAITNPEGHAQLLHVGDNDYTLAVRLPGYQRYTAVSSLNDATTSIQLRPATPVEVAIVDQHTGSPIPDARLDVMEIDRAGSRHSFGNPARNNTASAWTTYAVSNSEGKALLTELVDGTRYKFGVVAKGYALGFLSNVYPTAESLKISLVPPLSLSGKFEGDLTRLPTRQTRKDAPPERYVGYNHRMGEGFSDYGTATVADDGTFTITDISPNEEVTLNLKQQSSRFLMTKSLKDVVVKLEEPANVPTPVQRNVIVRITGTSPGAPARGMLHIYWRHPDERLRQETDGTMPLINNAVQLKIPLGATLNYRAESLVGYRIEPKDGVPIEGNADPLIINVEATPAGGIHGTIARHDGTPADSGFVTVFADQLPPGMKNHNGINPSWATASAKFLSTLPLRARYRILARELDAKHNVWTLSPLVTLDEVNPITGLALKLPTGIDIPVTVLDPAGKPIPDQTVRMSFAFSQPKGHSNSFSAARVTGPDGIAVFEQVSVMENVAPLTLSMSLEVTSEKYIGWRGPVSLSGKNVIQLDAGLAASGRLIDAPSGRAIQSATVRLMPRDFSHAQFQASRETRTDAKGEFHIEGLEPREYIVHIDGAVPKGTVITPAPGGGYSFSYPSGVQQNYLDPRQTAVHVYEVQLYPGGGTGTLAAP